MLYIHMAILLNGLFFPQHIDENPLFVSALSYCATFIFRPIGALFFGKIGDKYGRRAVVAFSSFMMSITCVLMAILPTYEQIGVTATYLFLIFKMIQGVSSMGEIVSAEIYAVESFRPPKQYLVLNLINLSIVVATIFSISLAYYSISCNDNNSWRFAFWIGSLMAFVGFFARKKLPETGEFTKVSVKRGIIKKTNNTQIENKSGVSNNKKFKIFIYLLIEFSRPATSYFAYIYCPVLLKTKYLYTSAEVLSQSIMIVFCDIIQCIIITLLCFKFRPIQILKVKTIIFFPLLLIIPLLLNHAENHVANIMIVQLILVFLGPKPVPTSQAFYRGFEVHKRMTIASMVFAVSRVFIYVITSFGIVYLQQKIDNWGVLVILMPITLGFLYALTKFDQIEKDCLERYVK